MTDEHDGEFERLMRDAARTYHRPPDGAPMDAMWAAIESDTDWDRIGTTQPQVLAIHPAVPVRARSWMHRGAWRTAAVLLLGVALGRASSLVHPTATSPATYESLSAGSNLNEQDRRTTNAYLGQAAALLIALPSELQKDHRDSTFVSRADNLLLETRLLLGSPAGSDPALHALFQDLEMVLAQVARLRSERDAAEVDLVTSAIEQRDVLPRLRLAVVDHIAN